YPAGMSWQRPDFLARGRDPQPQPLLATEGRQGLPVGREGDLEYRGVGALDPVPCLSGGDLPQDQLIILTAGRQPFAVAREGDGIHVTLVPLKVANFLARILIPQSDPVVIAAGGEDLAVRRERDADRKGLAEAQGADPRDRTLRQRI